MRCYSSSGSVGSIVFGQCFGASRIDSPGVFGFMTTADPREKRRTIRDPYKKLGASHARPSERTRQIETEPWPVFHLSDWLKVSFADPYRGFYWLGGFRLENLDLAGQLVAEFWQKYRYVDPNMDFPEVPSRTYPCTFTGMKAAANAKGRSWSLATNSWAGLAMRLSMQRGALTWHAFALTFQCCSI